MYSGTTELTIDAKGRLAVPARYRPSLLERCGGRLTVTRGLDGQLDIYPQPEWEAFMGKLMALPKFDKRNTKLQRHFLGAAEEVAMDKQGRVQLTPFLRSCAGLERGALFVGQGHKFELWDQAAWQANQDEVELDDEFLASIDI